MSRDVWMHLYMDVMISLVEFAWRAANVSGIALAQINI